MTQSEHPTSLDPKRPICKVRTRGLWEKPWAWFWALASLQTCFPHPQETESQETS